MKKRLTIAITSIILSACGSDNNNQTTESAIDYSKLEIAPQSASALTLAEDKTLINHISNGLRLNASNQSRIYTIEAALPSAAEDAAAPSSPAAGEADGFSETNVHVSGVDEADYAKYDGEHWFVATQSQYQEFFLEQPLPAVKIVATDPATPTMDYVGEYSLDDDWGAVGELYLVAEEGKTTHFASLRNKWGNVYPLLPGVPEIALTTGVAAVEVAAVDPVEPLAETDELSIAGPFVDDYWYGPQNSEVRLDLVDVNDPANPTADWSIELDGSLIQSRKVGNTLYLVTRYDPWISGLQVDYGEGEERDANEKLIEQVSADELMPKYRIGDAELPLTTNCYIQKDAKENQGLAALIHITAIDLAGQKLIDSQCLDSNVEVMSMTPTSLYLTGTYYDSGIDNTVVHKFDLTEAGPQYAATGSVQGSLGWRSDPVFRIHEYEDQLRIVTSQWQGVAGPEHKLTVLQQDGSSLATLSTLPNSENPDPIGKPLEDIYSVRFEADRAYIVTFQRTDPLYAIDLNDPANPKIAGELEIPGFATYMHPIGDYLFTLGNSADEEGRVTGLKAELISVANDNPQLVSTIELGGVGSYTAGLDDLRAISFLPVGEDQMRIAFPVNVSNARQWQYTGIQMLTVDGLSSSAVLTDAGVAIVESYDEASRTYPRYGMSRGVLHDDAVFINFGSEFWAANWFAPKEVQGPLAQKLVACTQELRMGLEVTVSVDGELDGVTACDASVNAFDGNFSEVLQAGSSDDPTQCTFYGAGERAGNYLIEASLDGVGAADAKTTVYRDECHVIPQQVEMTLESSDSVICTAQAVPSISLTLISSVADAASCDAQVFVDQAGEIYPLDNVSDYISNGPSIGTVVEDESGNLVGVSEPGAPVIGCLYEGPYELAGNMMLIIESDSLGTFEEDVFVPKGACHVETQNITIEF